MCDAKDKRLHMFIWYIDEVLYSCFPTYFVTFMLNNIIVLHETCFLPYIF
jgi:hypothetical protein